MPYYPPPSPGPATVQEIRYPVALITVDSTGLIPAGAYVTDAQFEITTPYSVGATVSMGRAGSTSLVQATTDNNPQGSAGDIFSVAQDTAWGGTSLAVRTTIAGAPAAGAGVAIVRFTIPST